MPMSFDEAQAAIRSRVSVTNQLVTFAKQFLLAKPPSSQFYQFADLLQEFSNDQGAPLIEHVVVHAEFDPDPQIDSAAKRISCELALARAAWELIGSARLQWTSNPAMSEPQQGYTSVFRNSGGYTGGWRFEDLAYARFQHLVVPSWVNSEGADRITDPDLFVVEARLSTANSEIQEAAADGVECLRAGLFRPAVVLLGKAAEGAWTECGLTIATRSPDTRSAEKYIALLLDPMTSLARRIREGDRVLRQPWMLPIRRRAGVTDTDIEQLLLWSDIVRDGRNGIHFTSRPPAAANYERVVTLFLQSIRCFGWLYSLRDAANDEPASA